MPEKPCGIILRFQPFVVCVREKRPENSGIPHIFALKAANFSPFLTCGGARGILKEGDFFQHED
jgi:hypothetical protein